MAGKQGPEAIELAVANTLTANLNAYLDALWTQYGDIATVPKVYPAKVYAGFRELVNDFPALVVTSIDGKMESDGAPYWSEIAHRVDVTAVLRSDVQHILDQQTKRYLWAIWKCLLVNQILDQSLTGVPSVELARYGRSGAYPQEEHSKLLLQAAGWEVIVRLAEVV